MVNPCVSWYRHVSVRVRGHVTSFLWARGRGQGFGCHPRWDGPVGLERRGHSRRPPSARTVDSGQAERDSSLRVRVRRSTGVHALLAFRHSGESRLN